MDAFKCDKCGAYIDNVNAKQIVNIFNGYGKARKRIELCPNCLVELEDYLGIKIIAPQEEEK